MSGERKNTMGTDVAVALSLIFLLFLVAWHRRRRLRPPVQDAEAAAGLAGDHRAGDHRAVDLEAATEEEGSASEAAPSVVGRMRSRSARRFSPKSSQKGPHTQVDAGGGGGASSSATGSVANSSAIGPAPPVRQVPRQSGQWGPGSEVFRSFSLLRPRASALSRLELYNGQTEAALQSLGPQLASGAVMKTFSAQLSEPGDLLDELWFCQSDRDLCENVVTGHANNTSFEKLFSFDAEMAFEKEDDYWDQTWWWDENYECWLYDWVLKEGRGEKRVVEVATFEAQLEWVADAPQAAKYARLRDVQRRTFIVDAGEAEKLVFDYNHSGWDRERYKREEVNRVPLHEVRASIEQIVSSESVLCLTHGGGADFRALKMKEKLRCGLIDSTVAYAGRSRHRRHAAKLEWVVDFVRAGTAGVHNPMDDVHATVFAGASSALGQLRLAPGASCSSMELFSCSAQIAEDKRESIRRALCICEWSTHQHAYVCLYCGKRPKKQGTDMVPLLVAHKGTASKWHPLLVEGTE